MYTYKVTVTIEDDIVHRYSIQEWEDILLKSAAIQRDELPLSYGRIAELLAEDYHRYGMSFFRMEYTSGEPAGVREETKTEYTNASGFVIDVRIPRAEVPST